MKLVNILIMAVFCTHTYSQKKPADNFGDWEMIYNTDVANSGRWMFYLSEWTSGNDTLVVKEIEGAKEIKIPSGHWGKFTQNGRFFSAFTEDGNLRLLDLEKNRDTLIQAISSRNFTPDEKFLVATRIIGAKKELYIRNLALGTEIEIPQMKEFAINPLKNQIALVLTSNKAQSLNILDLQDYTLKAIRKEGLFNFQNLVWNQTGNYLAFLEKSTSGSVAIQNYSLYNLESNNFIKLPKENLKEEWIEEGSLRTMDSNDYFFFDILQPVDDPAMAIGVQVWNTTDPWIYPQRKVAGLLGSKRSSWSWNPKTNVTTQLTDSIGMEIIPLNSDYILKYNKLAYEPQYKYQPFTDFYLHNLSNGKSQLLFSKQIPEKVFIAPDAKTIAYFQERDWWLYNIAENRRINLTGSLSTSFYDVENDRDSDKTSFDRRIKWTEKNDAILVSDQFDVWLLSLDGKVKRRLTNGREEQVIFRPVTDILNSKKRNMNTVSLNKGLLLHAEDLHRNEGCFLLTKDGNLRKLRFGPYRVDEFKISENGEHITFRTQSYSQPPKIFYYNVPNDSLKVMVESNLNAPLSNWGKMERFDFSLPSGESSQAGLIYPVNYDPSKKYPMIVNVYEQFTEKMHDFYPISEFTSDGFNPTKYALDGYFVLLPDIHFEIGNPGLSAVKYVDAALDAAFLQANIDKKRVGLFGFSYGGYESAFIATQTDRFAAIVSGAPVTNMVIFYHAINWTTGQEEMWRLEDFQMRMGGPYFTNKENYINNSPFHSVENVTTPILLWSGGNDLHIDYNENIRFFLSLRRLEKNAKLLLFEGEGHSILDLERRKYLEHAVKEWFDAYCK